WRLWLLENFNRELKEWCGVFAGLSEKEILENVKGVQVTEVVRFKQRDGAGDPPVLLMFKDDALPQKVFLVSMAFNVKEYIKPP
ncbi:hypothetical protein M9458_056075, partial [Cirrhinus mrigala]